MEQRGEGVGAAKWLCFFFSARLSAMIVLPTALAGGAMLPSFLFPDWLQSAQVFVPTDWATRGLAAMTWRGCGGNEALMSGGALLVFVAVGLRRFRWDSQDL